MSKKKPADVIRKAVKVLKTVAYGSCFIYSDAGPVFCPLCRVIVPVSTEHRCELKAGDR